MERKTIKQSKYLFWLHQMLESGSLLLRLARTVAANQHACMTVVQRDVKYTVSFVPLKIWII